MQLLYFEEICLYFPKRFIVFQICQEKLLQQLQTISKKGLWDKWALDTRYIVEDSDMTTKCLKSSII